MVYVPILHLYGGLVYEPHSKHIVDLGFDGKGFTSSVEPYIKTLFLHDKPNIITEVVQDNW